jgi:hypothetical protein
MAQHFKYNTGATINNTTQKGNIAIASSGTYDWGPTSVTGYYPETTPPAGGYTIYYMRATGGPSIEVATSDAQALFLLQSFGATGSTISDALTWASNTANYYVQTGATTSIITSGLVLNLDASNASSYPGSGTTWTDLSGLGNNATLIGTIPFSGGGFTFNNNGANYIEGQVNNFVAAMGTPTGYTIMGVVNLTSTVNRSILFTHDTSTAITIPGYSFELGGSSTALWTGGRTYVGSSTGNGGDYRGTGTITSNANILITATFNQSTSVQAMYVNTSTLSATNSATYGSVTTQNWWTSNRNYQIGYDTYFGGYGAFNGTIYNVMVYNRALSLTEVTQNYNALKSRFGI